MFVVNWIKEKSSEFMAWMGFLPDDAKILFLGLDNAGKTTLLRMMKDDRMTTNYPTLHPHSEELYVGKRRFKAFDLGGHEAARRIWKDYFADVDAIFFLVDSADRSRMPEAREELQYLLNEEALNDVPFAIMGNKIDIPTACSDEELRQHLGLPCAGYSAYGGQQQSARPGGGPCEVFMVSLANKMGYSAAFTYVANCLKERKQQQQTVPSAKY